MTATVTPRPDVIPVKPDGIPAELTSIGQWVVWKMENRKGKWTKPPYQTNGKAAATDDPSTWCSFEAALAAYELGTFSGVGFVFTSGDDFAGVDLDKCRDRETGIVEQWAAEIVKRFNTYTEVSPTGRGLKLFCRCDGNSAGIRDGRIEVYKLGRYITMTGHEWNP